MPGSGTPERLLARSADRVGYRRGAAAGQATESQVGSKRDQIRMTDDEVREFLEAGKSLQLATLGPDGFPHLVAMWYGLVDGKIVLESFGKSQKVLNMRRDPCVAAMVEAGTSYNELRGVSIRARAEVVDDPERLDRVMREVLGRNHPEMDEEALTRAVEITSKKRVAIVLTPSRVISWDHRKLGGAY